MDIALVEHIDLAKAFEYLQADETGAVNFFIGTVRNQTKGKEVVKLVFEAYEAMAIVQMKKIAEAAHNDWPLQKVIIQHVTGEKKPGEPVVLIGVTSAHRDASFEACRFIIDELKKSVPIWKKEYYLDNSIWVNAHP
jgi:molybdopterin synthase catalytic subunit